MVLFVVAVVFAVVVVHTDDVARCVDGLGPHQRWLHVGSYLIIVADALDSSLISIHQ